jgi:hypothetical protein
MNDRLLDLEDSLESSFREKRWFAALSAAKAQQAQCDALRQVRDMAEAEWRQAVGRLKASETLCDVLGEEVAGCSIAPPEGMIADSRMMSAA